MLNYPFCDQELLVCGQWLKNYHNLRHFCFKVMTWKKIHKRIPFIETISKWFYSTKLTNNDLAIDVLVKLDKSNESICLLCEPKDQMGQSIQEWTKQHLWKPAFKKFLLGPFLKTLSQITRVYLRITFWSQASWIGNPNH